MQPGQYVDATDVASGKVTAYLRWTAGATGAIASIDKNYQHRFVTPSNLTPIVRNSAGLYTVTVSEAAAALLEVYGWNKQVSYSGTAGAKNVDLVTYNLAAKTVQVQFTNAAGTATDPATGDVLTVCFVFQTYVLN